MKRFNLNSSVYSVTHAFHSTRRVNCTHTVDEWDNKTIKTMKWNTNMSLQ